MRRDICRARRLLLGFRFPEAFALMGAIEERLVLLPFAAARGLRDEVNLLQAMGLALQDNNLAAIATVASMRGLIRTHSPNAAAAAVLARFADWQLGNWEELQRGGEILSCAPRRAEIDILSHIIDAAVELRRLHVASARRAAMDALALAERNPQPGLAMLAAGVAAQALYEQGLLEEAEALLLPRLELADATAPLEGVWQVHLVLARIAANRQQHDFALLLMRRSEMIGLKRGWPRLIAASLAERVNLLLGAGRLAEAEHRLGRLESFAANFHTQTGEPAVAIQRHHALARARLALVTGSETAPAQLYQLYGEALGRRDLSLAMQLGLQMAGALHRRGRQQEGETLVVAALRLGAALGFFQVFLDESAALGDIVASVYERARISGSPLRDIAAYAGSLVGRRGSAMATPSRPRPRSKDHDCLSARESEILVLVSRGLSNKRIGQALKIAPETVKSHLKHIFAKLAAKTRAEAVARAERLGLLTLSGP